MKKTYVIIAKPLPSVLATPSRAAFLKDASATIEFHCSQMGRNNRRRMLRLVMHEIRHRFSHVCEIGGCSFREPVVKNERTTNSFGKAPPSRRGPGNSTT